MTADDLREILLALPPLELLGASLLRESPSAGFFPVGVPRETLRDAVAEMVAYTDRCQSAARRLHDLTPVPLTTIEMPEFVL